MGAIQRVIPDRRLTIAGFSLGGNFALRVAARAPTAGIALERAIAICPVLRPHSTMDVLEQGSFIYHQYFISKWKESLRLKQRIFPQRYDFISAWDSIWHVPLERHPAVLEKLCAALNPGGILIFTSGGVDTPEWPHRSAIMIAVAIVLMAMVMIAGVAGMLTAARNAQPRRISAAAMAIVLRIDRLLDAGPWAAKHAVPWGSYRLFHDR